MKENINDYREDGFLDLDEYLSNNPEIKDYPYYLYEYDNKNFWTSIGGEEDNKSIYVKPREYDYLDNEYSVYAELIYSELMKQVGIKTAKVDIAKYDGAPTVISENILEDLDADSFVIPAEELLGQIGYDEKTSIEDLYNAIREYCAFTNVPDEYEEKCIKDIQKLCIAESYAVVTSRKPEDLDFIAGLDKDGNEYIKLAPICSNPYALCSSASKDDILDMIKEDDILNQKVNACYSDLGVPENKRDFGFSHWLDSVIYFLDEDEENIEFAKECADKMNIDKAIKSVEENIGKKIPDMYSDFAKLVFDSRFKEMCLTLDLDYYKIMDSKYEKVEKEVRD